jgi:chromosome segregation ATPase
MDVVPGAKSPNPGSAMKKVEARGEDYVLKVCNNTQKYIEALIEENEGLWSLVGELEEQRKQSDRRLGVAESELGRVELERQKLAERIDQIEVESQDLLGQFQEIERQNSDLASL